MDLHALSTWDELVNSDESTITAKYQDAENMYFAFISIESKRDKFYILYYMCLDFQNIQ